MRSSNDCVSLVELCLQDASHTEVDYLETPILMNHDIRSCFTYFLLAFVRFISFAICIVLTEGSEEETYISRLDELSLPHG